ncbi:MAG: protease [bacterium]|nr:protease [bacterium]
MRFPSPRPAVLLLVIALAGGAAFAGPQGYYRQPALHGETLLFVAEGDLWKVPVAGGAARRLTSHAASESQPAISPDGATVAFAARYEGPTELYTMPLDGGRPIRRTYGADGVRVSGWTSDGRVMYSTETFSTLPAWQLVTLDVGRDTVAGTPQRIPLAQAADGWYGDDGTLFFTRLHFQGSHTKRYKGGTAQNIWRFAEGDEEARPLTADHAGTSKRPMVWNGRVYFVSDRDGTMNLWSMLPDGGDKRQHTTHSGWDVASPDLEGGRIAYKVGADIRIYDIAAARDRAVDITLDSDLDQTRENWVASPMDYMTSAHVSKTGDRVVLTARGRVFVAPLRQGRLVEATRKEGVRYREARFMPDGESLVALSDESGEVELWQLPANGVGDAAQLTENGSVLRWETLPSPDGKRVAHHDKDQRLFVYDVESDTDKLIEKNAVSGYSGLAWSPDGRWLAYSRSGGNLVSRVALYSVESGESTTITSERYESYSPAFSADGSWLYFLSERHLVSIVGSPWGNYQPEPYLDKTQKIFALALQDGLRSPFAPLDELHDPDANEKTSDEGASEDEEKKGKKKKKKDEDAVPVVIDLERIRDRLHEVSAPPGNYANLTVNDQGLFWTSRATGARQTSLVGAKITHEEFEVKTIVGEIGSYEMSGDGKKLLVRKGNALHVIPAAPAEASLDKTAVDLGAWKLSVIPEEEWRQMFVEAWRLERDYFYDRGMHGVDWPAMRDKYLPLVERVTSRGELADLLAQMVGELSALHIFVRGGDHRSGEDDIRPASLGAVLTRDEEAGGYRVGHVYRADPEDPDFRHPLRVPGVDVREGDVIESINGTPTLSVPDAHMLLRNQSGRQVLLRVKPADGGDARDAIVHPASGSSADNLRYHEWEYTRRLEVDRLGDGDIGYLHLRAMGGRNYTEWAKGYFPAFNRKGLIVDVRHNRGGNIDSWLLSRLLRRAWFGWNQHAGQAPMWNMQYAFRGHVVVLCNERTASDGEAFAEGIKRLDIGEVIGTRTWGGEIWLTSSNFLVDGGVATAAEFGVYGPQGEWLIEGHGVEPDIVVDNLPHATFNGRDAQLEAAVEWLQRKIEEEPVEDLLPPAFPDKSFDYN